MRSHPLDPCAKTRQKYPFIDRTSRPLNLQRHSITCHSNGTNCLHLCDRITYSRGRTTSVQLRPAIRPPPSIGHAQSSKPAAMTATPTLLDLPAELRETIYRHPLVSTEPVSIKPTFTRSDSNPRTGLKASNNWHTLAETMAQPALLVVNRAIRRETACIC